MAFSSAPPALAALRRDALREALYGAALLAALAAATAAGPGVALKAAAVFALGLALVLRGLPAHAPHARFGTANRVTLLRLALVAWLAAGLGEGAGDEATAWRTIVIATVAALMDAVDGAFARAQGLASEFGARFDMETDALLVLVLSLLVAQSGQAGAWIVAAGLMRYLFVAAAQPWPWLAGPLPPSTRRKTVCVVQITGLIVCLGPIIPPAWAQAIAAATLAMLTASFAVDIGWLWRTRRLA